MKQQALAASIFLLVCFIGFDFARMYFQEKRDRKRITESFQASRDSLIYYLAQNGRLAAKNKTLQLRYNELQQIFPEVMNEIRNLKIKPSQVTNYSETVVKQEKQIITHLKDSLIQDSIAVRTFNYQDCYYTIKGIAIGDSQHVSVSSVDSLIQVVYKGKRERPWLWFFSHRKLEQVITSKNPNSKIVFNRTIQLVKK